MGSVGNPSLVLVLMGMAVLAMLWRLLLKLLVAVVVVVLLFGIADVTSWVSGVDLGAGFTMSEPPAEGSAAG